MFKLCFFLILIALQISQSSNHFSGCQRVKRLKSILRGNYKNVITYENGSLLISRKQNSFNTPGISGMLLRNQIYPSSNTDLKGTYCYIGQSIIIELTQPYELNNFILWLWDGDIRYFNLTVYAIFAENETVIFDSFSACAIIHIQFPDQIVNQFRIYNRGGNTKTQTTNIVKAEAYYRV